MITNALIRIEGQDGPPSVPFGMPDPDSDFWVLELPVPKKKEESQIRSLAALLKKHRKPITRYASKRGTAVLFIAVSSRGPKPVTFSSTFIRLISDLGLSLEVYEERA